ncbi:MAG TPA: transposase [bacterium]|nr:transposase [bacterium]
MYRQLQSSVHHLANHELIEASRYSKSVFYEWLQGLNERKKRAIKLVAEDIAINAMNVILEYPQFGGTKGQQYMIYHRLGYIGRHGYQHLKKAMGRMLFQEVCRHDLLPKPTVYEHERPENIGEIWAEDFIKVTVIRCTFSVALVIDVFNTKYLGYAVTERDDSAALVREPVEMALEANSQRGPKKFLLKDNGSQYVSTEHGDLLAKHEIISKSIPACKPWYNGTIECGNKDFKSVFYNIIAEFDLTQFKGVDFSNSDEKKKLLEIVLKAAKETVNVLNGEIPRPVLGGVTPDDIHDSIDKQRRKYNDEYTKKEQMKEKVESWSKSKWELAQDVLAFKELSNKQILIKHYFFQSDPLRRINNISAEVWTN